MMHLYDRWKFSAARRKHNRFNSERSFQGKKEKYWSKNKIVF